MEIFAIFKTQGATLGSKHHGRVQEVFANSRGFLVQFAELALVQFSLPSGAQKWVREESLSKVKQVEVLSQDSVKIESSFEYVKSVKQPVALADVPARIVNRYKENFNYLVGQVQGFIGQGSVYAKDSLQATFGFKKVFLMLTEVGKLIAISSSDGAIQWTEYLGGESQKIIVRNMLESEGEGQQIVSILKSSVNLHNAADGKLFKEYPLEDLAEGSSRDFIMLSVNGA